MRKAESSDIVCGWVYLMYLVLTSVRREDVDKFLKCDFIRFLV